MSRVLGMHALELKPGVDEHVFEDFICGEILPVYARVPGQAVHLLKGDRGERAGKYLMVIEIASVERRDQIYPTEGQFAVDVEELIGNVDALWEKFYGFVEEPPDPAYTDYVVMSD